MKADTISLRCVMPQSTWHCALLHKYLLNKCKKKKKKTNLQPMRFPSHTCNTFNNSYGTIIFSYEALNHNANDIDKNILNPLFFWADVLVISSFSGKSPLLSVFCAQSLSCVWLFATPWTVVLQAPLCMGFSRQEYWSGLLFPSPGDLSWPRNQTNVSCSSCIGRQILYHWATWEVLPLPVVW